MAIQAKRNNEKRRAFANVANALVIGAVGAAFFGPLDDGSLALVARISYLLVGFAAFFAGQFALSRLQSEEDA